VREAAHAALLWWRDGALVRPPQGAVLPSITAALVAEVTGGGVQEARCRPDELANTEVWTVDSLHGISPVVRIDGRPCRPPDRTRLERWRRLLDAASDTTG
jgi:branched-subunit amino acid aminotransferase/4-amino-4-deoxychorismate lyase